MNRRDLLAASSSCIFLGVGGCLDDGAAADPTEDTSPTDSEGGTEDESPQAYPDECCDSDEQPIPELDSIAELVSEHEHGLHGELAQISATGSMVTDPIESSGELHVLLVDRLMETTESTLTVTRHTDGDESETQLLYLGRGSEWGIGATCFLPPTDGYQLDVQTEEHVDWELTVMDPAVFRAESSYETVSFNERNKIHARGGENDVLGAVRLSPGMRVRLLQHIGDVPLSVEAYTETGQKEVLFDETKVLGNTVGTKLEGVTWLDVTHPDENRGDTWTLSIIAEE